MIILAKALLNEIIPRYFIFAAYKSQQSKESL